jgi:acyl-CoA synthetase (AMP-forming)/AMP-acid ligase II
VDPRSESARGLTIAELLEGAPPHALALTGPGGPPITFGALRERFERTRLDLAGRGIGTHDTVAVLLPNGPEAAALLLSVMSCCRLAPLNPSGRTPEITYALRDLDAAALITTPDFHEALAAAAACDVPVIAFLAGEEAGSATFELETSRLPALRRAPQSPSSDEIALLLHTSGTTAHPKLVPLTHRNLCLSARAVAAGLRLTPEDRCLCVMPLFHIHGLVAGLLAPLSAGGSCICPPGFQAMSFFPWLRDSAATWYTGVPTMHQAILARAPRSAGVHAQHKLRLIRSCSAPLYPSVRERLTSVFDVPVVNAYGMTEAAHQISSECPSGAQTGVAVGHSTGPQIAIMDSEDSLAPPGKIGEVVLRGPQLMNGYLRPPGSNEAAFRDGWFRTGDEGFLDDGAALTLVGRIKEMINSGGEKISPFEVEQVLLNHPGVMQAVAFAMPHPMLGEAVACAIVLREDCQVTADELRRHAAESLSRHKIPRRFIFTDEVPRGATGKLQRIGLAARLGIA